MIMLVPEGSLFFFFNDTATTEIYTLSLHDALPIHQVVARRVAGRVEQLDRLHHPAEQPLAVRPGRSEEHTSELQSPCNLVCRLLLEKKKKKINSFFFLKKKKNNKQNI